MTPQRWSQIKAIFNGALEHPPEARAAWLRQELDLIEAEGQLESTDMPMLLTRLAAKHPVFVHYITGHWLDVDTLEDLSNARNFT